MTKRKKVLHVRSSQANNAPLAEALEYGEIAVNYNSGTPKLYIKDSANNVIPIAGSEYWKVSEHDEYAEAVMEVLQALQDAKVDKSASAATITSASTDAQWATAKAVYTEVDGIKTIIEDNEEVTAAALNYLDTNKVDVSAFTEAISNVYTKAETEQTIEYAISDKADISAVTAVNNVLTAHTADTTIHVTSSEKTTWNGKQDALPNADVLTGITSGKVASWDNVSAKTDTSAFTLAISEIEDSITPIESKLDTIESGANVNKIESISVNNIAQAIDANKNVDITIPQSLRLMGVTPSGNTLADAQTTYYSDSLSDGEAGAWFISYSNGSLIIKPSTSTDEDGRIKLSSDWESGLNYGGMTWANVGDILLVYRQSSFIVIYKVLSINEAGETRIGLMSPNDKKQVNKISGIETSVNSLNGKIDKRLPYSTDSTNIGNVGNGAYTNVTAGRTNWINTASPGAAIKLGNLQIAVDSDGRLYSRNQTQSTWNLTNQLKTTTQTDLNLIYEPSVITSANVTNGPTSSSFDTFTVFTFTSADWNGNGERSIIQFAYGTNSSFTFMRIGYRDVEGGTTTWKSWQRTNPTRLSELENDKSFINNASYDSSSKTINFYASETLVTSIDATDFIKDGMVSSAYVSGNSALVIVFNTDAGKEPISIPLDDIFDADNYYTTAQTDNLLSSKTDNSTFNAHSGDTAMHVSSSDRTLWNSVSGKQDELQYYFENKNGISAGTIVSGSSAQFMNVISTIGGNTAMRLVALGNNMENVKQLIMNGDDLSIASFDSVDGNSILSISDGGVAVETDDQFTYNGYEVATVNQIPQVDSAVTSSSTNPVESKAIYQVIADKVDVSSITQTISSSSTSAQVPSASAIYEGMSKFDKVEVWEMPIDAETLNAIVFTPDTIKLGPTTWTRHTYDEFYQNANDPTIDFKICLVRSDSNDKTKIIGSLNRLTASGSTNDCMVGTTISLDILDAQYNINIMVSASKDSETPQSGDLVCTYFIKPEHIWTHSEYNTLDTNISTLSAHTESDWLHTNTTEKERWNEVSAKTDTATFNSHSGDTAMHVSSSDRTLWNSVSGKQDEVQYYKENYSTTDVSISAATYISGANGSYTVDGNYEDSNGEWHVGNESVLVDELGNITRTSIYTAPNSQTASIVSSTEDASSRIDVGLEYVDVVAQNGSGEFIVESKNATIYPESISFSTYNEVEDPDTSDIISSTTNISINESGTSIDTTDKVPDQTMGEGYYTVSSNVSISSSGVNVNGGLTVKGDNVTTEFAIEIPMTNDDWLSAIISGYTVEKRLEDIDFLWLYLNNETNKVIKAHMPSYHGGPTPSVNTTGSVLVELSSHGYLLPNMTGSINLIGRGTYGGAAFDLEINGDAASNIVYATINKAAELTDSELQVLRKKEDVVTWEVELPKTDWDAAVNDGDFYSLGSILTGHTFTELYDATDINHMNTMFKVKLQLKDDLANSDFIIINMSKTNPSGNEPEDGDRIELLGHGMFDSTEFTLTVTGGTDGGSDWFEGDIRFDAGLTISEAEKIDFYKTIGCTINTNQFANICSGNVCEITDATVVGPTYEELRDLAFIDGEGNTTVKGKFNIMTTPSRPTVLPSMEYTSRVLFSISEYKNTSRAVELLGNVSISGVELTVIVKAYQENDTDKFDLIVYNNATRYYTEGSTNEFFTSGTNIGAISYTSNGDTFTVGITEHEVDGNKTYFAGVTSNEGAYNAFNGYDYASGQIISQVQDETTMSSSTVAMDSESINIDTYLLQYNGNEVAVVDDIEAVSGDLQTLSATVMEQENVVAAALVDLETSKLENSAITTSITSASTDAQIPSAKAVKNAIVTYKATSGTSGTAAVGSSSTQNAYASRWRVDIGLEAGEPYDGMTILYKVPVAGNGTYGTLLRIDGTDASTDSSDNLYPVCVNVNTMISTRYPVGAIIPLTFDASQVGATFCYNSKSKYTTKAGGTGWEKPGCWKMADYDSNTTTGYGYIDYYFRPYAGQAIYRYKFLMQGEDNRLYPITITNQTSATQVSKTPTNVALRPHNIWYYNATATTNANAAVPANILIAAGAGTTSVYNFNESAPAYHMIYLVGSYDRGTDLFTLYNDGSSPCKSYYVFVPANTANITLSDYFTEGFYYILLGGTYSSVNYFSLFDNNKLYYFDGTNLIPEEEFFSWELYEGISDVSNDLTTHTEDSTVHITSAERATWNEVSGKVDTTAITSSITSESTDDEIPTAKATYETISGIMMESEYVIATSLNDLNERLESHSATTIDSATSAAMHLPTVTTADNGKILKVVNGAWALVDP